MTEAGQDEPDPQAGEPSVGAPTARLPLAFLPLALTYLAVALNLIAANIALPQITLALPATSAQVVWLVNITPLASAALILLAGVWGDRFGRRRLLLAGIIVFLVAAILSAFASSIEVLILLRGLTGVGSALAMPAALALTFEVVPRARRRTAVGIISAMQAVGTLLGPLLAGALIDASGWGAAFLGVTPLLAISWVLVARLIPHDDPVGAGGPVDLGGAVLMGLASVMLLTALVGTLSVADSGAAAVVLATALGVLAVIGLVWWERRAANPVFVGSVVRDRRFWAPTLIIAGVQFAIGAVMFGATQYLQLVAGYSALVSGLFLAPALLVWIIAAAGVGAASARLGERLVLGGGLVLACGGLLVVVASLGGDSIVALTVGLLLTGFMGVGPALMTELAVSVYPASRRSVGSAINSVAVRMGLALGLAVSGATIGLVFRAGVAPLLVGLPDAAAADASLGAALRLAGELPAAPGAALADSARAAFSDGFALALGLAAGVLAVLAALGVWALPRRRTRGGSGRPGSG